jgi:hypothetical protein
MIVNNSESTETSMIKFHHWIYPLTYFNKAAETDLAVQLPVYVLNVAAFGASST